MMRPEEIYGRGSLKRHLMPCTSFAHALCICMIGFNRVANPPGLLLIACPALRLRMLFAPAVLTHAASQTHEGFVPENPPPAPTPRKPFWNFLIGIKMLEGQ